MKLSIVTVAYNAAATLRDTLESVARQSHRDVEHWLIDGGSQDDTRAVVARHGQHLAGFVSERDDGLYDAMNKGAARSGGEVIGFLNADDWYADPGVLGWVSECFERGADLVYGDLAFVTAEPPFTVRRVWHDRPHAPRDFFRHGWQPAHPATFIRLDLFRALGGFNTRWCIGADYAFLAATMLHPGLKMQHVAKRFINMRLGGASTESPAAIWRANRECAAALRALGRRWPWGTLSLKVARKMPQVLRARAEDAVTVPLWRPWDASRSHDIP